MTRSGRSLRSRRAPLAVLAGLAAAAYAASSAMSFVSAPVSSRRGLLAAGLAAGLVPALKPAEPVHAAGAPETLELSGVPGSKRAVLNGYWTIQPGQTINERAVYKRDGDNVYLMFNDCGSFQLSNKASGECNGFASESKGKWTLDGNAESTIRLKPVKARGADGAPAEEPSGGIVKLPQVGLTGKETDEELLFGKDRSNVNVVDYVKAKGGGGGSSVLDAYMSMDEGEAATASSLEAKLLR